jgi:hypothetical protein
MIFSAGCTGSLVVPIGSAVSAPIHQSADTVLVHPCYFCYLIIFSAGCTGSLVVPIGSAVSAPIHQSPEAVVLVHPLEEQTGITGLAVNSSLEGEVSVTEFLI